MAKLAVLAAVNHIGTGGAVLLYTQPAGFHSRLRRSVLYVSVAAGRVQLSLFRTIVPVQPRLIDTTPAAVPASLTDYGDTVLEPGDQLYITAAIGTTVAVWVSATVYPT